MLGALGATLRSYGVGPDQVRALVAGLDVSKVAPFIGALLAGVVGLATNLVFLLSLLLFISLEAAGADLRVAAMVGGRPLLGAALADFTKGIRRYLVVTTMFGLLVGALDTAALAVLGIPLAVTWGLLAFITNYIPYVGFWLGVLPPAVLDFAGRWSPVARHRHPDLHRRQLRLHLAVAAPLRRRRRGPLDHGDLRRAGVLGLVARPGGRRAGRPMTLLVKALLVDSDPNAGWMNALLGSPAAVRRLSPPPGAAGNPPEAD